MSLLDGLRNAKKLTTALASAAVESARTAKATEAAIPGLASQGVEYVDDLAHFHAVEPAAGMRQLIDFPGFRVGDTLRFAEGTELAGVRGISGTAQVLELTPTSLHVAMEGGVGPLTKSFGVHMHQLTDDMVEYSIEGMGATRPFLAQVDDARRGAVQVTSLGLDTPVSLTKLGAGRLQLEFTLGGSPSRIVLER
jgi:hypothetical protein